MKMFNPANSLRRVKIIGVATACFLIGMSCGELRQTEPETFYSETKAPQKQVFRWSNGKMPKSFDPALASAPPETDIVRAIYEGLTDTDPKTLEALPAIAKSWKSEEDARVWVFSLRNDAVWSNGEKVTAKDFVDSWNRVAGMGKELPHHSLLHNIVGVHQNLSVTAKPKQAAKPEPDLKPKAESNPRIPVPGKPTPKASPLISATEGQTKDKAIEHKLEVEATGDFELRVRLKEGDPEFPRLAAHPIFRPVYAAGKGHEKESLNANIVTNGAFRIASVGKEGVTLDREEKYFDKAKVKLERVLFVPSENADAALAAYRAGEVDVVTNASFEPLALKILTPYVDFRRTTHSALNYYEFNVKRQPFNDRRIREALAISIDREQLTEKEMEGSAQPAFDFLPFDVGREKKLASDAGKAKDLFEKSGFPNADGFPTIRLLINRNNVQERIAKSVAKMWKDKLNVETEILIKESSEIDELKASGEYDMIRKGVVLPTADETANMLAIFSDESPGNTDKGETKSENVEKSEPLFPKPESGPGPVISASPTLVPQELLIDTGVESEKILTEEEAIDAIPAIPLYFPMSYSLVKPYVLGFEMNTLDAPSLKNVYIDNLWQPAGKKG